MTDVTKITLTTKEVNQIIVDYLASKGQIEHGQLVKVTWSVDRFTPIVSSVTIEQSNFQHAEE